jgi:hypothetical protein
LVASRFDQQEAAAARILLCMRVARSLLASVAAVMVACGAGTTHPTRGAGGTGDGAGKDGTEAGVGGSGASGSGAGASSGAAGTAGSGGRAGAAGDHSDSAAGQSGGLDASAPAPDADRADASPGSDAAASMDGVVGKTLPPPEAGGPGPIGDGWTEIMPTYSIDQPPGQVRYTLTGSEFHFWVMNSDMSTFPGRDSGPRSEVHIHNNYTTGQAQYQADIKIDHDCAHASIMQVFGGMTSATSFMAWAMPNSLNHYSNEVIVSNVYDKYIHLNVVHDTATRKIDVYVDGVKRGTFQDHGPATHYFKCGVYHQVGMTPRCDSYIKNIRVFQK